MRGDGCFGRSKDEGLKARATVGGKVAKISTGGPCDGGIGRYDDEGSSWEDETTQVTNKQDNGVSSEESERERKKPRR